MPHTFHAEDGPQGLRGRKTIPLCGLGEEGVHLTQGRQNGRWRVTLPEEGHVVHLGDFVCVEVVKCIPTCRSVYRATVLAGA